MQQSGPPASDCVATRPPRSHSSGDHAQTSAFPNKQQRTEGLCVPCAHRRLHRLHSLTGLGSAMVQGSEGRGHANQDDRWTRRRDKSAAPARHSRSQDTTGARPPPSPWPAVGHWPRRKREGSRGTERRWRCDQDQVDSRRENVCACS